jgi:drug/metabolite transporter (DMT)-like permease
MDRKPLYWTYLKLLLMAFFWGGTFIAGRVVVRDVEPCSAAFLRFAIASLLLAVIAWRQDRRGMVLKAGQIFPVVILGLSGIFAYNILFMKGMKLIEAGRASMIMSNNPILIALLSAFFFKEKLTPIRLAGILASITGAVVVISRGHPGSLFRGGIGPGEVMIFGCVGCWVTFSLVGKAVMRGLGPLPAVTYAVLVGTLALAGPAFAEGLAGKIAGYQVRDWVSLAFLGVLGTVAGFVWFYQGIQKIGAMRTGLFMSFVPISGVFLAFLILGEPLTSSLLVGAILVTAGVCMTNRTVEPSRTR